MTEERALANAQAFAGAGFGVFSVWGIDAATKACRCPRGAKCEPSPGKHPIPVNGFHAATTDPDRVAKMLSASGSGGNYGVVPAPDHVIIDVDGEGWLDKLKTLGLPKTLAVETGNGVHLYFHWPPEYGPAPTYLFGWKVRSNDHLGYVVGPGSLHQNGKHYQIAHQNGHATEWMLASIADFPEALVPQAPASITVGQGLRQPESVPEGSRHDYLRDRARTLRGGGLTGDDLWTAMKSINARLPSPKSDDALRRAIGDVETKFGEDEVRPASSPQVIVPSTGLIVDIATYRAANSLVIEWVSPLAAYGQVALVSGPPKSGKSTLIGNLLAARETNSVFLWGDPVPVGPTVLVTEEGGYPVVRKTEGLTKLDVLDRMAFIVAGLRSLDHLLEALTMWHQEQEGKALVVIDTLAVWGDIEDENDATNANKAVVALSVWAQHTGAAVVLVHHARKGGGDHGEAIRGSTAIFGAVAHSAELGYGTTSAGDSRRLSLSGRLDFPDTAMLDFDRDRMQYSLAPPEPGEDFKLDAFPLDGSSDPGLRRADAEELWGLGQAATNKRLRLLVDQKRLVRKDVRPPGEKTAHGEYWKSRPLLVLDTRSVGERMADIIKSDDA